MTNFADRLLDALAAKKTPAVVALDPVFAHLPREIRGRHADEADAPFALDGIMTFCQHVLEIAERHVAVIKINSACFERFYAEGVNAYYELVQQASRRGLVVIGDVKRGDVGHTAEMYARAHLAGPDAITVSGYFGLDGVKPFIDLAAQEGKGIFVLVRTSNPSASAIQDVSLADGRKFHEIVAGEVANWAAEPRTIGHRGYSLVGAVVATRDAADAAKLRAAMPRSIFLVPGYGAQGGRADDFRPYFRPDGTGALIAAGRSVIFAYERAEYAGVASWEQAVEAACREFAHDVAGLSAPN